MNHWRNGWRLSNPISSLPLSAICVQRMVSKNQRAREEERVRKRERDRETERERERERKGQR